MTTPDMTRAEYFAAHAPPVPDWFPRKTTWEVRKVPIPHKPGFVREEDHQKQEPEMDRLVRWRFEYGTALAKQFDK